MAPNRIKGPAVCGSANTAASSPSDSTSPAPATRRGCSTILRISMPMRSRLTPASSAACARIASAVTGSIERSKRAAKRAARSMRNRSSRMRSCGEPIALSTRAVRSALPPTKSMTSPLPGSMKSPLTVKSRRSASSSGVAKRIESGRRLSVYGPSARKVATSTTTPPVRTSMTPKDSPTPLAPLKSAVISSGLALVATSKSAGSSPSS